VFFREAESNEAQLDTLLSERDPDRTAPNRSCSSLKSFEPIYEHNGLSLLILHGKLGWADANNDVSHLGDDKDDALA
jgi:hypothetical protein